MDQLVFQLLGGFWIFLEWWPLTALSMPLPQIQRALGNEPFPVNQDSKVLGRWIPGLDSLCNCEEPGITAAMLCCRHVLHVYLFWRISTYSCNCSKVPAGGSIKDYWKPGTRSPLKSCRSRLAVSRNPGYLLLNGQMFSVWEFLGPRRSHRRNVYSGEALPGKQQRVMFLSTYHSIWMARYIQMFIPQNSRTHCARCQQWWVDCMRFRKIFPYGQRGRGEVSSRIGGRVVWSMTKMALFRYRISILIWGWKRFGGNAGMAAWTDECDCGSGPWNGVFFGGTWGLALYWVCQLETVNRCTWSWWEGSQKAPLRPLKQARVISNTIKIWSSGNYVVIKLWDSYKGIPISATLFPIPAFPQFIEPTLLQTTVWLFPNMVLWRINLIYQLDSSLLQGLCTYIHMQWQTTWQPDVRYKQSAE